MSRTENSIRNIKYSVIFQVLSIFITFFSRMIFIRVLGVEILGLNSLFTNVLSVLSFADLGIGTAITNSMYKPIAMNDIGKISALTNLYKKIYKLITV